MADILYNVMTRPIANEPSQKDSYHVDRAHRDARIKNIEDDDPKEGNSQQQEGRESNESNQQELEQRLENEKKGKGLYEDEEGKKHLDFYA